MIFKMSKKLLLTVSQLDHGNNASSKPRDDVEYFLGQDNYEVKNLHININSKFQKALYNYWKLDHDFKPFLAQSKPDHILIQYPIYSKILMNKIIDIIYSTLPKALITFIVHDVESLRMYKGQPNFKQDEIKLFNRIDTLIVHNNAMKKWLQNNGVHTQMNTLKLFDYKSSMPINEKPYYNNSICFAGNLQKASFINKLEKTDSKFHIFGNGLDVQNAKNIIYEGSKEPAELPKFLKYSYGLIWDGSEITTCSGEYGDYLKYNSPHKASLYLSSGLPIIVWSQSALAPLVKKQNIGITIDSLEDLNKELLNISKNQYLEMKANTIKIAKNLRKGSFIKEAADAITTK